MNEFPGGGSVPVSAAAHDMAEPLRDLARLAQRAVSRCDGAGLTLMEDGSAVVGTSNRFAAAIDRVQYGGWEGPCVTAVDQKLTVLTGSIGVGEPRWPTFTDQVQTLGIRSALSLPLRVDETIIGSLNLYARKQDAFDAGAVAAAEEFARPAAESLSTARLLVEIIDAAGTASDELADRGAVETAVGILMATRGLSASAAAQELDRAAKASEETLVETAHRAIDRQQHS